jgi:hypothetical protein
MDHEDDDNKILTFLEIKSSDGSPLKIPSNPLSVPEI